VIDDILAGRNAPTPESPADRTPSPDSPSSRERLEVEDLLPDGNDVARLDIPYGTTSPDVKEEETVSLNTQEFKYYAYFSHIKRHIEMAWNYPLEAQKNQWEGRLSLTFVVESDGTVSDIILVHSSGHEILDEAAIKAIKFASPFNPIPESIGVKRLRINASFEYIASLFGVR
jgi:protein TonB